MGTINKSIIKKFRNWGAGVVVATTAGTLTAYWEDIRNYAYPDSGGVWTICYGETKGVKKGDYKTNEECEKSLLEDLERHNKAMKKYVYVPLSEEQEIAFTDFVYNVGEGNWKSSTALRLLNDKRYDEACAQMFRWVYVKGVYVKGLDNRRKDEYSVCVGKNADVQWALAYAKNQGYVAIGYDNEEQGIKAIKEGNYTIEE